MGNPHRMSPLTALFLGIWIVGGLAIVAGTAITLYGMSIIDTKANGVLEFAGETIDGLPDLVEALPPALADVLDDRRAPEYAGKLAIDARFVRDSQHGGLVPAVSITNNGDEVVSMLAIRVAALDPRNVPLRDWTQVVATPIAIEDDWCGPLMPHATRHIVLSGWRHMPTADLAEVTAAVEVSELRVWTPDSGSDDRAVACAPASD